jgi:hypothetical protein
MSENNPEPVGRAPMPPVQPEAVVEERSASSLLFQSLDAVGNVGLGVGTTLLGAAAWKHAGGTPPDQQQPSPPAEEQSPTRPE